MIRRRLMLAVLLAGPLVSPLAAQRRSAPVTPAATTTPVQTPAPVLTAGEERALWRTIRTPRVECRPAAQYFIWQWTRYAGPGAIPQGSPLTAMAQATNPQALTDLAAGVAHNQQAVGVYRSCAAASSVEYLVWLAATSSDRQCDMVAVNTNLTWQKQNALPSLTEAMRHWQAGRNAKTVPEENAHALAAVREMYAAVRHNPTASAAYRACFRDRPEDFFQAIRLLLDN